MPKKEKKPETEADRKYRLQQEAFEAEERARKHEEEHRLKLRQRQVREQRYAAVNAPKIHAAWRQIMRQAKVDELRHEIQVLSQAHEREVDRKDAIIQMLDRDLDDLEDQYLMALRGHTRSINALLDLQHLRMRGAQEQFDSACTALEAEFDAERAEIQNGHARHRKDLEDILHAMQQEFDAAAGEARQDFESKREEIKNRNSEEYNVLKISLDSTIEELKRHLEQAHQAYLTSTEARTNAFRQLTRNDAQSAQVIERRMNRLLRLQEALAHWRTKISTNSAEWEERNAALRDEKDGMQKHYTGLKLQMDRFRRQQQHRLRELSKNSSASIDGLNERIRLAERILKLGELCRRLETDQEKVTPFWSSAAALADEVLAEEGAELRKELGLGPEEAPEQQKAGGLARTPGRPRTQQHVTMAENVVAANDEASATLPQGRQDDAPAADAAAAGPADAAGAGGEATASGPTAVGVDRDGKTIAEWNYLDQFLKKFNKALLDSASISREHRRLLEENEGLKNVLRRYLQGISVSEDVMRNPANPLLVVNNRLQQAIRQQMTSAASGVGEVSRGTTRGAAAIRAGAGGSAGTNTGEEALLEVVAGQGAN
ncbi:unnamed protein product [Pedinophyceae sp. YPF-701]|nr:unnamed protein product [Pedinophyceae sp. YPF-701]